MHRKNVGDGDSEVICHLSLSRRDARGRPPLARLDLAAGHAPLPAADASQPSGGIHRWTTTFCNTFLLWAGNKSGEPDPHPPIAVSALCR